MKIYELPGCSARIHLLRAGLTIMLLLLASFQAQAQLLPTLRPILEVEGDVHASSIGEVLGRCILGLGDINSDGWPDFAVGARGTRKLNIYFGGPGILDGVPDLILEGGIAVAKGDLNGDGNMDIISTKPQSSDQPDLDSVFIYLGKPGPGLRIDSIPAAILFSEIGKYEFGFWLVTSDFNKDGKDDLVLLSRAHTENRRRGKVYVYMGKDSISSIPDYTGLPENEMEDQEDIWSGDVNGDTYPDLLVFTSYGGMPESYDLIDIYYGRPQWEYSARTSSQRLHSGSRNHPPWEYRFAALRVFDINNDGIDDLYFFAEGRDDSAFVLFGQRDTILSQPGRIIPNPQPKSYRDFYWGASNIGDINMDGFDDFALRFAVFVNAEVLIYPGTKTGMSSHPSRRLSRPDNIGYFGDPIENLGDVDGDGTNDILVASPASDIWSNGGYFAIYSGDRSIVADIDHESAYIHPSMMQPLVYPNPSTGNVSIVLHPLHAGGMQVDILDILGRTIHNLYSGQAIRGVLRLAWDGTDNDGKAVPSGNYILLAKTEEGISKRLISLHR